MNTVYKHTKDIIQKTQDIYFASIASQEDITIATLLFPSQPLSAPALQMQDATASFACSNKLLISR